MERLVHRLFESKVVDWKTPRGSSCLSILIENMRSGEDSEIDIGLVRLMCTLNAYYRSSCINHPLEACILMVDSRCTALGDAYTCTVGVAGSKGWFGGVWHFDTTVKG